MKISTTTHTSSRNWNVNGLVEEVENRRHFNQLFRQLRFTNRESRRDVVNEDLGHFNNLLVNRDVQELVDLHQLFSHQRHLNIERRQDAPLNPLLRPDLVEAVRPGAPELLHTVVVVERKVLCAGLLGEECFRNFAVYCVSYSSRPLPSSDLVRYGAGTRVVATV